MFDYHLTNIMLLILVATAFYWLLFVFENTLTFFLAAILFVVHLIDAEVVRYLSEDWIYFQLYSFC